MPTHTPTTDSKKDIATMTTQTESKAPTQKPPFSDFKKKIRRESDGVWFCIFANRITSALSLSEVYQKAEDIYNSLSIDSLREHI